MFIIWYQRGSVFFFSFLEYERKGAAYLCILHRQKGKFLQHAAPRLVPNRRRPQWLNICLVEKKQPSLRTSSFYWESLAMFFLAQTENAECSGSPTLNQARSPELGTAISLKGYLSADLEHWYTPEQANRREVINLQAPESFTKHIFRIVKWSASFCCTMESKNQPSLPPFSHRNER